MKQAKIPEGVTLHEIDPAKFYIIDIDSEKLQPFQVHDLKEELRKAGVTAGFIVGGRGGNSAAVREATEQEVGECAD